MIKKIWRLLCDAVVLFGMSGVILCGYDRILKMGITPAATTFIVVFALLFYFDKKKDKDE